MMSKISFAITLLLLITSCEKEEEKIKISDIVTRNRYYESEMLQEKDLKLYGKWEFLYSYGGMGRTYIEPWFDYLEIVKYGIYGFIDDDDIVEVGKIEVISHEDNKTLINFIKDDEYTTELYLHNRLVRFNSNDTLLLAGYNMSHGFTAYFKRIR